MTVFGRDAVFLEKHPGNRVTVYIRRAYVRIVYYGAELAKRYFVGIEYAVIRARYTARIVKGDAVRFFLTELPHKRYRREKVDVRLSVFAFHRQRITGERRSFHSQTYRYLVAPELRVHLSVTGPHLFMITVTVAAGIVIAPLTIVVDTVIAVAVYRTVRIFRAERIRSRSAGFFIEIGTDGIYFGVRG